MTAMIAAALLSACTPGGVPVAPGNADLGAEIIRPHDPDTPPPKGKPGECWATDVTPAIIETVSEQVILAPAVTDATGRVISPAQISTETRQRMVQDRTVVHFRTPCAEAMTVDFIATLQRALKARGYFLQPVTGMMDAATRDAIRRFQEPLGLDSPVISLAGARSLGIIATALEDL